jgi:hypothetical protein
MPGIIQVMALLTVGVGVLHMLYMLVNLFVITPRTMRRMVYEVTNYRIVVTSTSVFTSRASQEPSRQRNGWKELTWPATTTAPPAFIGLADPRLVCELIGAAQLAGRVP